jgi:hypothetical protein
LTLNRRTGADTIGTAAHMETESKQEWERLEQVAQRLSELSRESSYNVYSLFEWPESLPASAYWLSPELVTCYGTAAWEELTEEQRIALTHSESVNFFSLNVHLIRELIGRVADRIYTSRFPGVTEFFHDFISEENEHMWFFATFCQRYGGKLYPARRMPLPTAAETGPLGDLTVFGRILIAEEICDWYNAHMAADSRLPPLIQRINEVHHRDEARHIAFGRQMMRALSREAARTATAEDLAKTADYLGRYVMVCLRSFYNSSAYADAGLGGAELRSRMLADPARSQIHQKVAGRTVEFLSRIGLCDAKAMAW